MTFEKALKLLIHKLHSVRTEYRYLRDPKIYIQVSKEFYYGIADNNAYEHTLHFIKGYRPSFHGYEIDCSYHLKDYDFKVYVEV